MSKTINNSTGPGKLQTIFNKHLNTIKSSNGGVLTSLSSVTHQVNKTYELLFVSQVTEV